MAGEKDPAFLFYAPDWLTDSRVRGMTREERGIYIDLLSIAWIDNGLPTNLDEIANIAGMNPQQFAEAWGRIGKCWFKDGDRYRNKRQEEERKIRREKAAAQKERSRKGNEARHGSGKESPQAPYGSGQGVPQGSPSTSTSTGKEGKKEMGVLDPDRTHTDGTAVPGGRVGDVIAARPASMGGPRAAQGGVA